MNELTTADPRSTHAHIKAHSDAIFRIKLFYYRGLKEWDNEKGFLIETCLSAQDKYKKWLDYFEIKY